MGSGQPWDRSGPLRPHDRELPHPKSLATVHAEYGGSARPATSRIRPCGIFEPNVRASPQRKRDAPHLGLAGQPLLPSRILAGPGDLARVTHVGVRPRALDELDRPRPSAHLRPRWTPGRDSTACFNWESLEPCVATPEHQQLLRQDSKSWHPTPIRALTARDPPSVAARSLSRTRAHSGAPAESHEVPG